MPAPGRPPTSPPVQNRGGGGQGVQERRRWSVAKVGCSTDWQQWSPVTDKHPVLSFPRPSPRWGRQHFHLRTAAPSSPTRPQHFVFRISPASFPTPPRSSQTRLPLRLRLANMRNNLPAVRQYLETFAVLIYLKFPTLVEEQLIPIFHDNRMQQKALSSYVFIAANVILHSWELTAQINHLNQLLPPILPFLTSHHHSLWFYSAILDIVLSWKARRSLSLAVKLWYILKLLSAAAWVIILPVTYAYTSESYWSCKNNPKLAR